MKYLNYMNYLYSINEKVMKNISIFNGFEVIYVNNVCS